MKGLQPDMISAQALGFDPPAFMASELSDFLQRQYGVGGEFRELEGERDQNFHITSADGQQFVLKISGLGEDAAAILTKPPKLPKQRPSVAVSLLMNLPLTLLRKMNLLMTLRAKKQMERKTRRKKKLKNIFRLQKKPKLRKLKMIKLNNRCS